MRSGGCPCFCLTAGIPGDNLGRFWIRRRAAVTTRVPPRLGRPDPLLGPAPRGTGLATFTASGSSRPVRSDHARPYDSLNWERVVRRSTHRGHGRSV